MSPPFNDRALLALCEALERGDSNDWGAVMLAVEARILAGAWESLMFLFDALSRWPRLGTLARQALIGAMLCDVRGARAFLEIVAQRTLPDWWGWPEEWGALMARRHDQAALAALIDLAGVPGVDEEVVTRVLRAAVQERVLRDERVDHPTLVAWWTEHDALPLVAHEWERGLLLPMRRPQDTYLNGYSMCEVWPRGVERDEGAGDEVGEVEIDRAWFMDDYTKLPEQAAPPVGPFNDGALYPNGLFWCLRGRTPHPEVLGAWPLPLDEVDLRGLVAAPATVRGLFRQWLTRGLSGGAYAKGRCVLRARAIAWQSLARLLDAQGDHNALVAAAEGWQVWGFTSRGPMIEHFGGDLGWLATSPDGVTTLAAHTDGD